MRILKGFTYIEMLVAVFVVMLMASIAVPNIVEFHQSQDLRTFKAKLIAYAKEARSIAIDSGDTVTMTYDKDAKQIEIVDQTSSGQTLPVHRLKMPDNVTAKRFSSEQQGASAEEGTEGSAWKVSFYSDGACAGGGIEFSERDEPFSFVLQRTGSEGRIVDGPLPDLSLDQWQAGSYAQRS